ncbi:MAG: hypothetical protein ABIF09_05540 [Gemmatimonadota bacterium]
MTEIDATLAEELLSAVGAHLAEGGDSAGIVVVRGSSMAVRGWVERTTQDIDVIAQAVREQEQWVLVSPDPLPEALVAATGWVVNQDAAEAFPGLVKDVVEHVRASRKAPRER